jgi:hypothetical protein
MSFGYSRCRAYFWVSLKLFDTYLKRQGLILLLGMTPSHPKVLEHRC